MILRFYQKSFYVYKPDVKKVEKYNKENDTSFKACWFQTAHCCLN